MRSRSRALAPWLALFVLSATLAAPASAGTAVLSWTAPTQNTDGSPANLTGYGVHRRCQAGAVVQIATLATTPRTYTDAGIPDDGRTCWYSLTAIDATGPSVRTNEVSKTFAAPPPTLPGSLVTGYVWSNTPRPTGPSVPTFVTSRDAVDDTSGTVIATPTGAAVLAGDVLITYAKHEGGSTTSTLTDNAGGGSNAFTALTNVEHGNGDLGGQVHWAIAKASESLTFTATFAAARPYRHLQVLIWRPSSGKVFQFDAEKTATTASNNNAHSSGSYAVAGVGGVAATFFSEYTGTSWTPGSGWTERIDNLTFAEDRALTTETTITGDATSTSSMVSTIHSVAFKEVTAGGATMAADAGSFAVTGAAAALIRGRKMPAATATFALTGTANAFKRTRPPLVATTAGYSLTGTATALRAARRMAANTAAYLLTGAANALRWGHALPAQSSSYSITGAAAALRVARRIAGNTAAYALTGTATALTYTSAGAKLVADAGAYVLTGSVTALRAARRMAANTAAFALAGTAAALTYSGSGAKTLIANAGAFVLTGTATALRAARRMAGTTAAFTLSGTVALLYRGRRMPAATAAYVITGTATALRAVRRLVAQTALFLLTGTPASLTFGQTRYYYLAEALRIMASQIIASLGNTDVTIDYSGPGQASGIRAIRGQKSFDPSIGARFFGSSETEFIIDKLDQPASLAEGVLLRDETNGDVFRVRRLTYTRGGLTTISIKNIV